MAQIMIVDDELGNRNSLARLLFQIDASVVLAEHGRDALDKIQQGYWPDLIILDLLMPVMDGITFLKEIRNLKKELPPIMVCSANTEIPTVVKAMQFGASEYIEKPIEPEIFLQRASSLLERAQLKKQNQDLLNRLKQNSERRLVGHSSAMNRIYMSVERLANTPTTVLIHGESGTGKELVARSLHECGDRKLLPFIVVDCAAVHGNTIEGELFGHEKGAYTGATQSREGLLTAAGRGTVFLDEIGELPLELQAKLLRVLQERQVRALGSTLYRPMHARVIAATNRDLLHEVETGRFREDLFYRLSIVQLRIPPLRERREDITLLVSHFLNKYAEEYGVKEFKHEALQQLKAFDWPGNVRQLENCVHSCMALAAPDQEELGVELLQDQILLNREDDENQGSNDASMNSSAELLSLKELELQAIQNALAFTKGNRRQAAEILGIGEATLYRKIKDMS